MSFKLTIGRTSFLKNDAFHNEAIISIFPFHYQDTIKKYLRWTTPESVSWGDFNNTIKGSSLNKDYIDKLIIPLPPLKEQQRIVEKIEEVFNLIKI
ncbi:restriction endonuclease subunit S [Pasteurellaceae bacterium 20609_3]|nr:restriction endonuclease subunit S [Spirabiliibacterium mucosae]